MPKRSASRTTITVAFGTSTPTSITVVATSTSSSPAAEAPIAASFSADGMRPCSSPSASRRARRLEPVVGLLGRRDLELLGLLDERAHDVGLAPGGDLLAHLGPHSSVLLLGSPCAHTVTIGVRPAAARRGRTRRGRRRRSSRRCAGSASPSSRARRARRRPPLSRSAARCSTPKRCCSSMTTTPSERKATPPGSGRGCRRGCRPRRRPGRRGSPALACRCGW